MALPTKADLLLLGTSHLGKPFVDVEAKALNTVRLDVSHLGKPFVGAAGGVVAANYTLVCAAGAYSYTGNDATLTWVEQPTDYTLTCDAGAYAYSGNDATLTYVPGAVAVNYTLTCDAGAYSYLGNDATLTYVSNAGATDYTLVCDAGSYAYTGNDATLTVKKNYVLACDAGAYSYTGNSATLTYVSVSSGSYNIRFNIVSGQMETGFETEATETANIENDVELGKLLRVITPRIVMTL